MAGRRRSAAARGGARRARRRPHVRGGGRARQRLARRPGSTSRASTPRSRATSTPSPRSPSRPTPGFRAALELRGVRDLDLVMVDTWSVGPASRSRAAASAARWPGCAAISRATTATRARSAACSRSSTSTSMQVVRIDDHGVLPVPSEHGDYRNGGGRPYRDDLQPIEVAQPEGSSLAAGRPRAHLGAVARAHRLQPARVADAARARLRRGRRRGAAPDRAPALDRRARDPVCRHEPDRRLQERVRHRRVRPRRRTSTRSRSAATASARSATSTRSCTTARGGRRRSATPSACTRRTPGILWKHFDWRSGATDVRRARKPRDLVDRDGRQLRVRRSTGTSRSTAPSPSRPSSRASCTPPAWPTGDAGESATLVAPGVSAGLPPALLLRAPRPGRRRRAQRALEVDSQPDPAGPANPHRQSFQRARDAARERARGPAADRPALGPALARRESGAPQPHGASPSRTSSCRARTSA